MVHIDFSEFNDALETAIRQYPDEAEKTTKKVGRKLIKELKANSPEKTGNLKKSWKGKDDGYGTDVEYDIYSKAPHFHLQERGHDQLTPSKRFVKHIQGKEFFEKTTQEFVGAGVLEKEINNMLRRIARR